MGKVSYSKKIIKEFLTKTFDIREGEFKRAFLMMLYIFLVISSNLILKPTVISLFLSEFGVEQLPLVFIFVAVFAAVGIAVYSYSLKTTSINIIIVRTFLYSNISFFVTLPLAPEPGIESNSATLMFSCLAIFLTKGE